MTPGRRLLVGAGLHALGDGVPAGPPLRALIIDGDRIVWVGADLAAAPPAAECIDLGGAWITPAFVDAHVHATATGLAETGVDLAGAGSAAECLDRLRRHVDDNEDRVVYGARWDDFGWPSGPPSAAEVGARAPGRTVMLRRVDGHSCVVDPVTLGRLPLDRLDGVDRDADGRPTGWLREAASEAAQIFVRTLVPPDQFHAARTAACRRAAALGIASLHEMGHPGLSGLDDAVAWATGDWLVEVLTWWAVLDPDEAAAHGLRPGGDLFLDGSIGSGTAATTAPYSCGERTTTGELFNSDDEVAAFFTACTRGGRGAGVHAIGDRAIEQALVAIEAAADTIGSAAVRACRHRVEHVELPTPGQVGRMAALGIVASVQPAFDAEWGGDDGLYAARFGRDTARVSNPLAWFAEAGVAMAFGSDSTVTPMDPWGGVVAAERHLGDAGVDRRTAWAAATLGGRHVAGQDDVGALRPGGRADFAVWSADPLAVEDPRVLDCLATVVGGRTAFGRLSRESPRLVRGDSHDLGGDGRAATRHGIAGMNVSRGSR